jgi:predicted choloylglycine hydrolase
MKYIITESQYNNTIDKFITYYLEPHEEIRTKKFPDSIFWVKDGEVISEIENSEYFWVSPRIWEYISSMFSLEYSETQQVIKDWLEEHYKLGGLTPEFEWFR